MTMPEDILRFWFGDSASNQETLEQRLRRWFGRDDALDRLIRDRFSIDIERGRLGEIDAWKATARGRLALIVLLDQFPRNAFRGTKAAFASDWRAAQYCRDGLELGADHELVPIERLFFYLPLMHSEHLLDQRRSVQCFEQLAAAAPASQIAQFAAWAQTARRCRGTIEWFGRFPHRNAILGRNSSAKEQFFIVAVAIFKRAAQLFTLLSALSSRSPSEQ